MRQHAALALLMFVCSCSCPPCAPELDEPPCGPVVEDQAAELCADLGYEISHLDRVPPNRDLLFVYVAGLKSPRFDTGVPLTYGGRSFDAFVADHPRGYGCWQFADLDGDGDVDATAPGRAGLGGVDLLRNEGGGVLAGWQWLSDGYGNALCDVDEDGDIDIVAGSALYINDGSGGFDDEALDRLPEGAAGMTCVDANGDGAPDLLNAGWNDPPSLLLNDGTGRFARGPAPPTAGLALFRFALPGDLDGDGADDVVLAGSEGLIVLLQRDGALTLSAVSFPESRYLEGALGDVDRDGDLDLALEGSRDDWASGPWLFLNESLGEQWHDATERIGVGQSAWELAAGTVSLGDFDGDGDLDWERVGAEPHVLLGTVRHPVDSDRDPPMLEVTEPVARAPVHIAPELRLSFHDDMTGVDPRSLAARVNATEVTSELESDHDSAVVPLASGLVEGENVLEIFARDVAGNGVRATTTFSFDPRARPFATYLEVLDASGRPARVFAEGEPITIRLRFRNGSGTSLPVASCRSADVRVYDCWGNLVFVNVGLCPRALLDPEQVPPCSERDFGGTWLQDEWIYGEPVDPGTYYVQGCVQALFPDYVSPAPIEIRIK